MIFIYLQIVGPEGRFSNGKSGFNSKIFVKISVNLPLSSDWFVAKHFYFSEAVNLSNINYFFSRNSTI